MNKSTNTRITFLGIGLMGLPMASRLLQAGFALTAWNRDTSKTQPLAALGAQCEVELSTAVANADVIISMLTDGNVVLEVQQAASPALHSGQIWIDMSSTRQDQAQQMAARLQPLGVAFLDAPVSGGVLGAQAGSLAIMVGGEAAAFAQVTALLQVLGRPTLVGAAGCGQLAKLCNQLIVGGTLNLVAEALLLAQAGGADASAVRQAIRGGFAESRILEVHGERMLQRKFLPGGQIKSQAKDMENVLAAAQAGGVHLPLTELVTHAFQAMLPQWATADQSAALLALEARNPGVRVGTEPDQLPML
ncbi:MAG: NAD(P)-dependent oxidoreductase [Burkholderiales bacterium]|nr:NAD(P)-dependent oxidoreductase [Burkholderiales bacterium]